MITPMSSTVPVVGALDARAGPPVVTVDGALDLAAGSALVASLDHHLALGHRYVRVDLAAVDFADCAGLAVLLEMHDRFLAARGTMILTGLHGAAARLVRLMGVDHVLLLADDLDGVGPGVNTACRAGVASPD